MRLGSILAGLGRRPGSIFVDFLLAGLVFAEIRRFSCQEASKSDPGPKKSTKWTPNASQNDPTGGRRTPKRPPGTPQRTPETPKRPQETPKRIQEAPKRLQEASKRHPRGPKRPPEKSRRLGPRTCGLRGIHTLVPPEGGLTAAPQQSHFSDFVGVAKRLF